MNSAEEWAERYLRPGYWAGTDPEPFLVEALPFLPRGHALDVASGEGRHSVYLAAKGWAVTAVDRAAPGHDKAAALAAERGVPVAHSARLEERAAPGSVLLVQAELESAAGGLPARLFDVVVCFKYLQRSLFDAMARALRPSGVLVYQTYTVDQLDYPEGPRDPQFLLQPDELRTAVPDLEKLYYSESNSGKGIACLLARRC